VQSLNNFVIVSEVWSLYCYGDGCFAIREDDNTVLSKRALNRQTVSSSGTEAVGKMRKVKCGMECAESYCGTVGNMRNAESCRRRSDEFSFGVQGCGWGRPTDQIRSSVDLCTKCLL